VTVEDEVIIGYSLFNCSLVEVEISWLVSSVDVAVEVEEELVEDCSLLDCSLFVV
jgi:hypothetical protein